MDVNKAVRYVFDDPQWLSKLLIGVLMSVLGFLILPALILQGYLVKIIRQVMVGDDNRLPEWSDWGELMRDGFFVTVGQLIWTLPFILLLIIGGIATGGLGSLADNGSDLAVAGAMGSGLLLLCLILLMVVAFLFITPALLIQYAIKDEFGALFQFGEIWDIIRNNMSDILIAFLVTLVAAFAVGILISVLSLIPCLGWIAAFLIGLAVGPYISYVSSHLYGQIAGKIPGSKAGGMSQGPYVA